MIAFSANQIAAVVQGEVIGNGDVQVHDVSRIEEATEGTLCFVNEAKYLSYLETTKASIVLVNKDFEISRFQDSPTLILVANARAAMAQLLQMVSEFLFPRKKGIEQPSFISESAQVGEDCYIGAFAYIGKNAKLGKCVQIYPQAYIGDNVEIGEGTIIYAGAKIYAHCKVGKGCIIHAGVVIGADGFGFEPNANRVNQKVPQIGNVVIEDDVEIGANTTIDRAMMGSTIVRENAKLDNLVQIGHNVEIGRSTILCAEVGIAGSTKVGEHCILAGQVGVAGHIEIADNCVFGAQSGISGTISQSGIYMGSPAIDAGNWRRSIVGFKRLPEIMKDLKELKR